MKLADFDYRLSPERIAQRPVSPRDHSRLLVLDRVSGGIEHARFDAIGRWLEPADLLVLNDTRVLAARLVGHKTSGGRVELLLLEPCADAPPPGASWRCLLRASRPPGRGSRVEFGAGVSARVLRREAEQWVVRFEGGATAVERLMSEVGQMPLPPYIRRPAATDEAYGEWAALDRERYQTVFARHAGAVAAPTAGLHFTEALLERLRDAGVDVACLTLHVGAGTFLPVRVQRIEDHVMHDERFVIDEATAAAVRRARAARRRVVAVGTTVVRALEHSALEHGEVRAGSGRSDLFIRPGFGFRVVDALVTNFHLPRSTLLMLVSAFAGRERTLAAYREALERDYRFYSYGDAMLIRSTR